MVQEVNEMLITKEDLVTHFAESDDTLENFISIAKAAFNEAEAKRDAAILEKLELFAIENNMSIDKVKALFTPKVEAKPKKAGKGNAGEPNPGPKRNLYIYELDGKKYGIMRGSKGVASDEMILAIGAGQKKEEMKARGEAASEAVIERVGDSTTPVDITDLPESA